METRIIAFAGAKQSGKSTCSNFIHGYELCGRDVVDKFMLSETGRLIVKTNVVKEDGKEKVEETFLDTSRKDEAYVEWAMYNVWPFVKKYSFADTLKEIAITLFGLSYEQVYGDDSYKNQRIPHLRWENMPGVCTNEKFFVFMQSKMEHELAEDEEDAGYKLIYHAPGPMTAREFLQYLGTDVMRKMYEPIWVERLIKDIQLEQPAVAVVDDVRFVNEIEALQQVGAKVIGLNRCPHESSHSSEQIIKEHWDKLDHVIDNDNDNGIHAMCKSLIEYLNTADWPTKQTEEPKTRSALHTIKETK